MQKRPEVTDQGITAIYLPSGQVIEMTTIRTFNYNPNIGALRFSFNVRKTVPVHIDPLSSRVRAVQEEEGRCVVIAHKFFRHDDILHIQDADVKIIQT